MKFSLTENEAEIMEILWEQARPLSRADLLNLSPERSWSPSSIHIILNRLLEKGAIVVDGFVKTGKSYGRTYSPSVKREDYFTMQINSAAQYVKGNSASISRVVSTLIQDEKMTLDTIKELEDMIRKRKEDLE